MNNNTVKIVLMVAVLLVFAAVIYVYLPIPNRHTRITVVGNSQTKVAPDTALITFSVVTQNSQAVNAQQENAKKSETVKTAIEAVVDDETEIKTSNYNLSPEQNYSSERMPKIIGYEVRNTVTVALKDITKVGAVVDAATKAGANSIEGIAFVLREDSPTQGDAIGFATRQAMAKAEAIAKSLNGKIVRIVETNESGTNRPTYESSSYASNSTASNASTSYSTPLQAGSVDVRSQITLVVEVEV